MSFNFQGMLTESDEKLVVLAATNRPQVRSILSRTNICIYVEQQSYHTNIKSSEVCRMKLKISITTEFSILGLNNI